MNENEISRYIVTAAIEVHKTLGGPGLLESVYEEALVWELLQKEFLVERQKLIPIDYKGVTLATPLRIDVLVNNLVIIECKSKIPGSRVNLTEVYKWRNDRVPLIYKILRNNEHFANKKLTFELWTNGPIATDAAAWLKADPIVPDYEINWKDGETMKAYVDKASSGAIRKAMSEHYFRHPLARLTPSKREKTLS